MQPANDFKKIKQVLEFVWNSKHSSFYRKKYTEAGIHPLKDITSWEDFKKLPYLTKDELLKTPVTERNYSKGELSDHVIMTSGTTSSKEPLLFLAGKKAYSNLGSIGKINLAKRTLLLCPPFQTANVFYTWQAYKGKAQLFFGDINNLELCASLAQSVGIDSIFTSPTVLYHLLPTLEKVYDLDKIKLIILRGEYCSKEKFFFFKEKFKNAYFEFLYGSLESLRLGYRCKYLANKDPRFYHCVPSHYLEVLPSENGDLLVVTSLSKNGPFPLVRYLTSDIVKLTKKRCRCKNNTLLEVVGRAGHDMVKLSGGALYSFLVEQSLAPFGGYIKTGEFEVHIFEKRVKDKIVSSLTLKLIPQPGKGSKKVQAELQNAISQTLYLSSETTLADLVQKGIFSPLKIEFVITFPSSYKHRKLISHIV